MGGTGSAVRVYIIKFKKYYFLSTVLLFFKFYLKYISKKRKNFLTI